MSKFENWPDFLKIAEGFYQMQEKINQAMRPVAEILSQFQSKFSEVATKVVKASRPLIVISELGKAQFVYWDFLNDEFADAIISTSNINKTLREICVKDKFSKVNNTIDLCSTHSFITPQYRIFSQTVDAYRNKQYDLATVGLLSIIDILLSDISGNTTTSIYKRADAILKKSKKLML